VLQEALTNILKHAEASQVWVDLSVEDNLITLTVQDDGHGFITGESPLNGIGLAGLQERLTVAGGKLNISSTPKRGTILSAQFPLSDDHKAQQLA
jgi:signal transduction histidine kinase